MAKKENKVDFDLSALKLDELVQVYENINSFLLFLKDKKIVPEEKEKSEDE